MNRKHPLKKLPKPDLARLVPPGFPLDAELGFFWLGCIGAALYGLYVYASHYSAASRQLYGFVGHTKQLIPGAVMPDFVTLLPGVFTLVPVLIFVLIVGFGLSHYQFFYLGGSRSIYLMRRLPDKWELPRRCLALPLAEAAIVLLTAALLFLLCFLQYLTQTPPECLTPHQWAKIWSVIP